MMSRAFARIVPHVSIVLSGMPIVFFILDQFNPAMGYLDNTAEKLLIVVLAVTSIVNAILLIGYERRA